MCFPCPTDCGNGRCEYGEACTDASCSTGCDLDCVLPILPCPIGRSNMGTSAICAANGMCQPTGACMCGVGYAGAECSTCAPGFVRPMTPGPCVFLPGVPSLSCHNGVQDENEAGVDCGGPCAAPCASLTLVSAAAVIGIATTGVFLVCCLTMSVLCCTFCRDNLPPCCQRTRTRKNSLNRHNRPQALGRTSVIDSRRTVSHTPGALAVVDWSMMNTGKGLASGGKSAKVAPDTWKS